MLAPIKTQRGKRPRVVPPGAVFNPWAGSKRLPLAVMVHDMVMMEMICNRALIQKIRAFRLGLARSSA